MTRPLTLLLALLLAGILALAGCGGGGDDSADDGGSTPTTTQTTTESTDTTTESTETSPAVDEDADPSNVAYQGAYELCVAESVESLASVFGIDPPTNAAVADAVAEQVAGGLPESDLEQGRLGCLAGLEAGS
jgi:hypothetical protein